MSRSRRKTPRFGITTARSDKPFKVMEHRRERAAVRGHFGLGEDGVSLLHAKAFGDPWRSCKDGKHWMPTYRNMARGMRK